MPRASLNFSTRSDFAVPGGPTSSSGSWATAATVIRSMTSCLWTKNRPSDTRKRLMRDRNSSASACRSASERSSTAGFVATMSGGPSWSRERGIVDGTAHGRNESRSGDARQDGFQVAADPPADEVLVVVEPAADAGAEDEVLADHGPDD